MTMSDERLKIWINFWKWFLSTIVITGGIAITTTFINAREKETQIQLKVNEQEKEYLTSFLARALDDNLEKRHRFAQYFASLTTPGPYRDGWLNYLQRVESEVSDAKQKVASLTKDLETKEGHDLQAAKEKLKVLRSELRVSRIADLLNRKNMGLTASFKTLDDAAKSCPEKTRATVWMEPVGRRIDEITTGNYLSVGCIDNNDVKVGPWTAFYPNGSVVQKGNYVNGKLNGLIETYYENGKGAVNYHLRDGSLLKRQVLNKQAEEK